jgi:transcriptional regulator with XRE-family HTH domain
MHHREAARILASVMKRMRKEREAQGLTLQKLGKMSGVSRIMIAKMEKGERSPGLVTGLMVADALGLDLGEALKEALAKSKRRR